MRDPAEVIHQMTSDIRANLSQYDAIAAKTAVGSAMIALRLKQNAELSKLLGEQRLALVALDAGIWRGVDAS